jgi:LysM repeat protein
MWNPKNPLKGGGLPVTTEQLLESLPEPPDGMEWIKVRVRSTVSVNDDVKGDISCTNNSVVTSAKSVEKVTYLWKLVRAPNVSWKEKVDDVLHGRGGGGCGSSGGSTAAGGAGGEVQPEFLEHVVTCLDTLSGISLKYNVPTSVIMKSNRMFSSNSIQAYKVLKIPNNPSTTAFMQDPKEILTQQFRELTGEPDLESRIYLEDASWDIKKAIYVFNEDTTWAVENSNVFVESFENSGGYHSADFGAVSDRK